SGWSIIADSLPLAIGPPLALLAVGAAISWLMAGFNIRSALVLKIARPFIYRQNSTIKMKNRLKRFLRNEKNNAFIWLALMLFVVWPIASSSIANWWLRALILLCGTFIISQVHQPLIDWAQKEESNEQELMEMKHEADAEDDGTI